MGKNGSIFQKMTLKSKWKIVGFIIEYFCAIFCWNSPNKMCTVLYISSKFAAHKLYLLSMLLPRLMVCLVCPVQNFSHWCTSKLLSSRWNIKDIGIIDYTNINIWRNALNPDHIICNFSCYSATDICGEWFLFLSLIPPKRLFW